MEECWVMDELSSGYGEAAMMTLGYSSQCGDLGCMRTEM
jgi:hypothetical protein